ncbi:uncharacterized protein LOC127869467 [Dreissena polymorpha]|nr:uncharacterized protein LOC127869467 [Dreissena polymorpha]
MAEDWLWFQTCDDVHTRPHRGLYSRNYPVQCENTSLEICAIMNCLGYGWEIRQARRDAYKEHDRLMTANVQTMIAITAGSKAEGLTSCFESDLDLMLVMLGSMCLEDGVNFDTLPMETIVLILNTGVCYHGHCRLNLLYRRGSIIPCCVLNALCDDGNGGVLLSSTLFLNFFDKRTDPQLVYHERAGPSLPSSKGPLHKDMVHSLYCHCPGILLRWAKRSRHWPPPDIVHKVVTMGAFVTPVGFKGSEYQHVEWRICFNTGENELVSNLNNIQVYIYVILKMVVKDVLKPVKKEITSYTVKNIVLWLAENNPQALFNESSLFYWLREGLGQLRTAILNILMPYYMIPERNLMAACGLNEEQKSTWVKSITDMISEGQKILFRLPRIRKAIISHPEPLLWYNKKRLELELLELYSMKTQLQQGRDENRKRNESDRILQEITRRITNISGEVRDRMNWEGSCVFDLDEIFTKMLM